MRILIALTGDEIDHDIAATAALMFDPGRDQIVAVHVAHPREMRATYDHVEPTDTAARGADLSAMSPDRTLSNPTEGADRAADRIRTEFSDHVRLITARHLSGFTVEPQLLINDDPADAIVEAVATHSINAITMGTRSKQSRLAAALLGNEAETVLRRVSVPVTIVKEGTVAAAGQ